MQAKETKLQDIIEGTKQYVVPLFQRTYSWTEKQWEILWKDLVELCEMENPRMHFIGSIVTMPTISVPEGVAKYMLIDGQQRLTTIFILLALLKNQSKKNSNDRLSDEINNTLLVNQYKDGIEHYKLIPTQSDRQAYQDIIDGKPSKEETAISKAYVFFEKKLKQTSFEIELLKKIITNYFSVVSIVLDADDNPYLVFESLNAKGSPLTQADLIRNYFFMRIHTDQQEMVYKECWLPMQQDLREDLTEFIRHFLMKDGDIIKQGDIYYTVKNKVSPQNAIDYLKELKQYAGYYRNLKYPHFEKNSSLRQMLERLNKIEVTTAYPLLLNFYNDYVRNRISENDFFSLLKTLENYLIRRFVCSIPTNQLNKIFPPIYSAIQSKHEENIIDGFKITLQNKGYPKDSEFSERFCERNFYTGGGHIKTKLILEIIESSFNHKELVSLENLTLEHILPQTQSEWWKNHLGEDCEETYDFYLHTIGNLTLTAYNSELSNDDLFAKKNTLKESHLELNKYFVDVNQWKKDDILYRSKMLAQKALKIWSYFGVEASSSANIQPVTGTVPRQLKILGQSFDVESWRDVLEHTLNTIIDFEPKSLNLIIQKFPKYINADRSNIRECRQLKNGYFFEVNFSAQHIQKLCHQIMEIIDLETEEWQVVFDNT